MKHVLILLCLLTATLMAPIMANAQTDPHCRNPDIATGEPPSQQPVEVSLGFIFTDITGVSDVDQNIDADIEQIMEWSDPRLAGLSGCFLPYTSVWTPHLELLNSSRLTAKYTQALNRVEILDGGRVRYVQRYSGTISTYHQLENFPFDRQVFDFGIFSPLYNASVVKLVPMKNEFIIAKRLNIEDWSFGKLTAKTTEETFPAFSGPRSVLRIDLEANRHVLYYLYKVLVPLLLIVSMSWIVFWIPASKFETQIGFAATSMLTMIAFLFSLSGSLPKLNYFTSMDYLVLGATILVYAAMVQALITGILFRNGYEKVTQRVEVLSRILFPSVLLLFWVIIIYKSYFLGGH